MGSVAPYGFPNGRRGAEMTWLSSAAPGGTGLPVSLVLGLPPLVLTANATGQGASSALVGPLSVALVNATGEGTAKSLVGPLVVALPDVAGQGTGSGLVVAEGVVFGQATGQGVGSASVVPIGVALADVTEEGQGAGLVTPAGGAVIFEVDVTGHGTGSGSVTAEVVTFASATGQGVGVGLVDGLGVAVAGVTGAGVSTAALATVRVKATLVDRLGPKVADLRATLTLKIGDRPYRVYLTTVRWSGGAPGHGSRAATRIELGCGVDKKTGLIQPPKIEASSPLKRPRTRVGPRGSTPGSGETDTIYLTQVDPRLLERDIVTLADLTPDQEAYVEIEPVGSRYAGVGAEHPVRRYRIAETPQRDAIGMQWVLALVPMEPSKSFGGPRVG